VTGRFDGVGALVRQAVAERATPAVAIEIGGPSGRVWRETAGALTYDPGARPAGTDTVFDLASLTKVMSTASLAMRAIDDGRIALADPIARWLPSWHGAGREDVTVGDLLAHASGLAAYLPLYRHHTGRAQFESAICGLALEYTPRAKSIYSDLGFILLGFVLEDALGSTLADAFAPIAELVAPEPLGFTPPREWRERTAPTEVDPWRDRLLVAEVHDENAWALGGVAGHAGLFGTVGAVGAFARLVLRTLAGDTALARQDTMRRFVQKPGVGSSSRALGWDTMLPTSSCGGGMSPRAFGHTGFTGTSLWIDPDRGMYVALLSNRVHPRRDHEAFKAFRPLIHSAAVAAWDA
jgi:CubicO group peptidase (beta-lactamase class C family)